MEDERKWCVVFNDTIKRIQKYPQNNEDLKVSLSELKEQLETLEEVDFSIVQIVKQTRNERSQRLFESFDKERMRGYIVSLTRWDTQLKGVTKLERRYQDLIQEVKLLSERQDVLTGLVDDKIRLQSKAIEKYYETIFEELRELEETKPKEALLLVQKKTRKG